MRKKKRKSDIGKPNCELNAQQQRRKNSPPSDFRTEADLKARKNWEPHKEEGRVDETTVGLSVWQYKLTALGGKLDGPDENTPI